jgi:hypothetical protein
MKNKLSDLNNHLFEQIERLNDDDLKGDDLEREIRRGQAMCNVAGRIIDNGKLVLEAVKAADMIPGMKKVPLLLE